MTESQMIEQYFRDRGAIPPRKRAKDWRNIAERFRAALELIATPMRTDGTYNSDRTACCKLAREVLDYENANKE